MPKRKMSSQDKQEYLESISFSNLVKAIDEKWSHTYVNVPEKDSNESEEETSC